MIQQATRSWEACGITFHYNGLSNKSPGKMDGENVIVWKDDGRHCSAWTGWRIMRSSQAIEADITLYSNGFNSYRHQNFDAKLELRKTIIHELGHVLSLQHSDQRADAMTVKVHTRAEWKIPSDNDINLCRTRYSG